MLLLNNLVFLTVVAQLVMILPQDRRLWVRLPPGPTFVCMNTFLVAFTNISMYPNMYSRMFIMERKWVQVSNSPYDDTTLCLMPVFSVSAIYDTLTNKLVTIFQGFLTNMPYKKQSLATPNKKNRNLWQGIAMTCQRLQV